MTEAESSSSYPQEPGPGALAHEHEDWALYLQDLENREIMEESDPSPWWLR